MPLTRIFKFGRKNNVTTSKGSPIAGIDDETLDIARNLAFEKKLQRAASAKWKRKASGQDDELSDALSGMRKDASSIMRRVFLRTVEDTVLANRFKGSDGKEYRHLTVKKAAAMDGLRDLDDDIGVSSRAATPANPEGRFNVPVSCAADHQFAERFNEAMNPIRNGRFHCVIPEALLEHFASYSTFIGYPLCEVIACHPTVSNACTIPGEDAIAPGYTLSFVDSEDMNGNGVPDDLEAAEMGGVKRSLGRIGAMEALKDAIQTLSGKDRPRGQENDGVASIDALALALERLAAYEEWEREVGAGEDSAQAVNEGFVKPVTAAFEKFSGEQSEANGKEAIATLSLALADLAKNEHPVLGEVRANAARRGTIAAVATAYGTLTSPDGDWELVRALNDLAVAVERVGAYEELSDKNAEAMAALTGALTGLSLSEDADSRARAVQAVEKVRMAMDADDFDWGMQGNADAGGIDPILAQLERERQEDRQAKAIMAERNAKAKEDRISEMHRQRMEIARKMAEQKMGHRQEEFEARKRQQEEQASASAEEKIRRDEKRSETKISAEVAKERQKYLDKWKERADSIGINEVCTKLARTAKVFGIGFAIPIVDGANYEEPMNIDGIREGAYHGFTVVEPLWIYPEVESEDLVNPISQSFFEPTYWAATGSTGLGAMGVRRIHRSWMVIVRNKEVPNNLKPMYYYGGISLPQEIYEAVFCADKLMNEVPKLAMTKRSIIVKGEPTDLVTNPEGVVERLSAISQVQDSFGLKFVGRNTDVVQLETSLSEFDQCIAKANQRVAAIAKMPETKLFKTQLAGMNSAGRYEWDDYSQLLITIQNNWFKPLLALHYKLDTKSRTGKVIELKVTFNPIDVPTQAEKGEAESRSVQTINSAVQGGWLAPSEARTIARSKGDSMFSSISAEMPEELEQQQQMPMGGGVPGMPDGMPNGMPNMPLPHGEPSSPLEAPEMPEEPKAQEERK